MIPLLLSDGGGEQEFKEARDREKLETEKQHKRISLHFLHRAKWTPAACSSKHKFICRRPQDLPFTSTYEYLVDIKPKTQRQA